MLSVSPRLLVSVRNAEEAITALLGGAEIIDVKEPLNGSLGCASAQVIRSISRVLADTGMVSQAAREIELPSAEAATRAVSSTVALSLALGEVREWIAFSDTLLKEMQAALVEIKPHFLKLGLAGLMNSSTAAISWQQVWKNVRSLFPGNQAWVAVAYADHERAKAPDVSEVSCEAIACGCKVLLIDTFVKDGTTLLDWLTPAQLCDLRQVTRLHGVYFALAGRVTEQILPILLPTLPDIVGVRGAVCESGSRAASISVDRVNEFRASLHRLSSSKPALLQ